MLPTQPTVHKHSAVVVENTNMLTDNMMTQRFDTRDNEFIILKSIQELVQISILKYERAGLSTAGIIITCYIALILSALSFVP